MDATVMGPLRKSRLIWMMLAGLAVLGLSASHSYSRNFYRMRMPPTLELGNFFWEDGDYFTCGTALFTLSDRSAVEIRRRGAEFLNREDPARNWRHVNSADQAGVAGTFGLSCARERTASLASLISTR